MGQLPNRVSRRRVIGSGAAAGLLGITGVSAQTGGATASNLKASVTLNGATYTYPDGPKIPSYYVIFHQDGSVVFHLGTLGDLSGPVSTAKPYHLGPHHVRIEGDGKVLLDADIPAHWWNAQWTYRARPLAVVKTPAQIVAAKRMFPFGDMGARVTPPANYTFKGPMDSAGITKYMPTTGERPDIGLITDASAYYMLGGKPGPMLAWAQAAGSCPLYFRDEKTGKPIDLIKYPQTNAYDQPGLQGSPWLPKGPKNDNGYTVYGDGWTPQQAHFCEMSYLAHVATGDQTFLEDLQYEANFVVLTDGAKSRPSGAVIFGELRGLAWGLRQLFMAHVATQDAEAAGTLPATCHPSSYFKALLNNALKFYSPIMKDPAQQTFRLVGGAYRFGPWQCDYMLTALAFGVLTGHSDWSPLYLWALGNAIARTNGTSGYPPGYGGAYYMNEYPFKVDPSTGKPIPNEFDTSKPQFNWAQSTQYCMSVDPDGSRLNQAQIAALAADPLNGGKAMMGQEYLMTTRAALVMAAYLEKLGLANVRASYPDLDTCIANVDRMVRRNGSVNPRTSVIL